MGDCYWKWAVILRFITGWNDKLKWNRALGILQKVSRSILVPLGNWVPKTDGRNNHPHSKDTLGFRKQGIFSVDQTNPESINITLYDECKWNECANSDLIDWQSLLTLPSGNAVDKQILFNKVPSSSPWLCEMHGFFFISQGGNRGSKAPKEEVAVRWFSTVYLYAQAGLHR